MRIFILKIDRSVEVLEVFSDEPHYVNINYKKGQIFRLSFISAVNSNEYWDCLHRGSNAASSRWTFASKVPDEIKMAALIVD